MANVNETVFGACRFLDDSYFGLLHETFLRAFSDYVVPFALTEDQFRNHIVLTGVDLNRSVGCVIDDRLVGFSLNGFGMWNGRPTVYDAGTGVVPEHRRRGISNAMFELMFQRFRGDGIKQFLLEVVTTNTGAVRLYEKLGFEAGRSLSLLQCDSTITSDKDTPMGLDLNDVSEPPWELFSTFWDTLPSWQNSAEALSRSIKAKRIIGAWAAGRCVGYIVFSAVSGRLAQLAVASDYRRAGVGTSLVKAMQAETAPGFSLQVINIDRSNDGAIAFFRRLGFYERVCQNEMLMTL
jgi:ribosomal protein S18 acetylase RimI-like enzyme